MIDGHVRLFNLTRRNSISSLITVKVWVVAKCGTIQRKRVMLFRRTVGGKRQEAQLFIPYRLHGWHGPNDYFGSFTYSATTKWGCSTLQEFLNHVTPSHWTVGLPRYTSTFTPTTQHVSINPFCRTFSLVRMTVKPGTTFYFQLLPYFFPCVGSHMLISIIWWLGAL
jgi:hypothetical protein